MVHVKHRGRLGNQMCQYAVGRIIAEAKGYKMETEPSDSIVITDYFPGAISVEGAEVKTNKKSFGLHGDHRTVQHLDMDIALKHDGLVYLGGYWQKHHYYTPHVNKLREWFNYDDSSYEKPNEDDIVAFVRLDDYLHAGISLAPKVYIDIINTMGAYNQCIIQTDSPEASVLDEFKCLKNVVVKHVNTMADFTMLKCARRLILSQSSFGFWAALLGNPEIVYVPLSDGDTKGWWRYTPGTDDIDLVPAESKYIKIKV